MPPKAKKRKAADGGAAAVSAESAVRASTRRGAGTNNSAASAAQAARDEAEQKRHKRDLAAATKQSRRDEFAKEESTQGLWAWGADCEGWKLAHTATRTQVLDGLVKIGAPPVSDRKVFVDNWRYRYEVADKKAKPPPGNDALPPLIDEHEREASESDSDGDSQGTSTRRPASAGKTATHPLRACNFCCHKRPRETESFRCEDCGLRSDLALDHPTNVMFRGRDNNKSQEGSGGSSGTFKHTETAAAKEKLSRRDKELERVADEGKPFPRFSETATITHEAALDAVRDCLDGVSFSDPLLSLVKLVRSFKLTRVGFALPRLATLQQTSADFADGGLLIIDGQAKSTGDVTAPVLRDFGEFIQALHATILPALFDRPRALLDWLTLSRSVQKVNDEDGWPAALAFLDTVLQDRVTRRAPLNDPALADRVHKAVGHLSHRTARGGYGSQAAPPMHMRGAGTAPGAETAAHASAGRARPQFSDSHEDACREWNLRGSCKRGNSCNFKHTCMWLACKATGSDRLHRGSECAHKPPGGAGGGRSQGGSSQAGPPGGTPRRHG